MSSLNEIKKRIRVYISGGISGKPNGNKEAFEAMETKLHAMGFDVENPRRTPWPAYLSLDNPEEFREGWKLMMRHAIRQQSTCDAVVFLSDWQQSRGAVVEYQMTTVFGQMCFDDKLEQIVIDGRTPARLLSIP